MSKINALVMTDTKKLEMKQIDMPEVKDDEVLIKTAYAGICGTDDALYNGLPGSAPAVPPIVLGHENSGVVEAVGKNVKSLKAGDRVTVDPNKYCNKCYYCHIGKFELCENLEAVGVTRNGGLEDYFTANEQVVYKLPDEVSLLTACSIEPISCAVHTMKLMDEVSPYQKALVIGDGYMGKIFAQMLRAYGIQRVDMTGRHDDNLAKEKEALNLNNVINTTKEDIKDNYDVVIECVGMPETQEMAVEHTNRGAQVFMFGVGAPDQTFSINTYDIFNKQLTIKGSMINPIAFEDSLALLASHAVEVEPFIENIISIDEVEGVLSGENKKKGKTVVKVDQSL